jgi:L-rhamnonate dehydratase
VANLDSQSADLKDNIQAGVERITAVRTRVFQWRGDVKPLGKNLCTNAYDLVAPNDPTFGPFTFHSWLVVEIETSSGIIGIGNAALAPEISKDVIDRYLAHHLLDQNPFDVELLWQRMYRSTMAFGRKGVVMAAISAVDIAIWDVLGKICNVPVYRLLGGKTKSKLKVYASKLYNQDREALLEETRGYKEQGFKAMKLRLGKGPLDGAEGMRYNEEAVAAVREEIGPDIDLMVDVYMGWTLEYTRQMVPRLAPYNLRWLEESVIADDVDGYAELKAMNMIPIAGGEHEHTIYGFRQLLEKRAVDYIQFDTNRVGGISQARKIVAMAEAFSVPVVPHAGQMHNYHISMSSTICPISEYFPPSPVEVGNELFWYLFEGELEAENGFIELPEDRPGLGISINQAALNDFKIIE